MKSILDSDELKQIGAKSQIGLLTKISYLPSMTEESEYIAEFTNSSSGSVCRAQFNANDARTYFVGLQCRTKKIEAPMASTCLGVDCFAVKN